MLRGHLTATTTSFKLYFRQEQKLCAGVSVSVCLHLCHLPGNSITYSGAMASCRKCSHRPAPVPGRVALSCHDQAGSEFCPAEKHSTGLVPKQASHPMGLMANVGSRQWNLASPWQDPAKLQQLSGKWRRPVSTRALLECRSVESPVVSQASDIFAGMMAASSTLAASCSGANHEL